MSDLFDDHATQYDQGLERGISLSGESKSYFARGRISWLKRCVKAYQSHPKSVLDFGCGTGTAAPYFIEMLGVDHVIGVDSSFASLEVAKRSVDCSRSTFCLLEHYEPAGVIDLAFSNGVFHHILPALRSDAVRYVFNSLASGALFSFWENNPWNPATRLVMKRIPFDRDAQTLSALKAHRLLRSVGFQVLRTDFLFIFPRFLRTFRGLERHLSRFPLGTQYQVLCRKP